MSEWVGEKGFCRFRDVRFNVVFRKIVIFFFEVLVFLIVRWKD